MKKKVSNSAACGIEKKILSEENEIEKNIMRMRAKMVW